jgi:hypothetical protein
MHLSAYPDRLRLQVNPGHAAEKPIGAAAVIRIGVFSGLMADPTCLGPSRVFAARVTVYDNLSNPNPGMFGGTPTDARPYLERSASSGQNTATAAPNASISASKLLWCMNLATRQEELCV